MDFIQVYLHVSLLLMQLLVWRDLGEQRRSDRIACLRMATLLLECSQLWKRKLWFQAEVTTVFGQDSISIWWYPMMFQYLLKVEEILSLLVLYVVTFNLCSFEICRKSIL